MGMTNYVTAKGIFNKWRKENNINMVTSDPIARTGGNFCEQDATLVYCDLFGDRVAERICFVLKKEVNTWWRDDLFCRGCHRRRLS
jgi:hypothetical protein